MSNKFFIEKYNEFDEILKYKYAIKNNKTIVFADDIVVPLKIDNRQLCSVPENQLDKPHCAGFSCGNFWESIYWKRTGRLINLDSDQIYAKAKQWYDEDKESLGTYLESTQKACARLCGFNDVDIGFLYNDCSENTIFSIKRLIHQFDIVQIGCNITTNWYNINNDRYLITPSNEYIGGHAILAVGYDSDGLYIQNSWGKEWGSKSFAIIRWDAFLQQFMYACVIKNMNTLGIENI